MLAAIVLHQCSSLVLFRISCFSVPVGMYYFKVFGGWMGDHRFMGQMFPSRTPYPALQPRQYSLHRPHPLSPAPPCQPWSMPTLTAFAWLERVLELWQRLLLVYVERFVCGNLWHWHGCNVAYSTKVGITAVSLPYGTSQHWYVTHTLQHFEFQKHDTRLLAHAPVWVTWSEHGSKRHFFFWDALAWHPKTCFCRGITQDHSVFLEQNLGAKSHKIKMAAMLYCNKMGCPVFFWNAYGVLCTPPRLLMRRCGPQTKKNFPLPDWEVLI